MRLIFQRDVDGASGDVYFMRLAGLSTETKPTENVATGSIFIEVDTDKKYVYNEQTATWAQQSGSSVTPEAIEDAVEDYLDDHPEAVIDPQFVATFSFMVDQNDEQDGGRATCDKTYLEILNAYNAHKKVVGYLPIDDYVLEMNFQMLQSADGTFHTLLFIGDNSYEDPGATIYVSNAYANSTVWDVGEYRALSALVNTDDVPSYDVGYLRISNLESPEDDNDAANKEYVDNASQVKVIVPAAGSGNGFTLNPCPTTYEFGTRSLLAVMMPDHSHYHFSFISPVGTPTVLTMQGHTYTAGDEVEADKYYEVDVWDGVALIKAIDRTYDGGGAGGTGR